jgi:hypothetical protein
MTHPTVRRIGLGKTGILARNTYYFYAKFCEGFVPFAYGFNTANTKKLGERYLGYLYLDIVPFWIKKVSRFPFKAPGIYSRLFPAFTVEEVRHVDDEWDDFFGRACPRYKFLVKRDAAYLRWRYLECPDKVHRIFAVRKRGKLVGWSVFIKESNLLRWGDALFDNRYLESVSYLLHYVLKAYFAGVETIEAWFSYKPEWWSDHLKSIGFEVNHEPNGLTCCYVTYWNDILDNNTLDEKLNNCFYYTWGDSDLF